MSARIRERPAGAPAGSATPGPHDGRLRPDLVARLLRPGSVAIVGFSAKPGALGGAALSLLDRDGFGGDVHLVGRGGGIHGGRPVLAAVDELPEGIDLAVLALPAAGVPDAVAQCAARGVRSLVIFSAGFAELGDEGRAVQDAMSAVATDAGMGIAGPNCLGFVNFVDAVEVGFLPGPRLTPLPASAPPGVAIVVHSGGLMGHILWALQAHGLTVAYQVSTGNEAGLGLADYVAYMADDPAVGIITVYAEHIRQPGSFLSAIARARAAGKHVVMLHTGRSQKARTAAASHTGALAGDHAVMRIAVARAGVLVVETIEELIDCTEFFARYPVPPRADPAVATASGAICAIAHDTCEDVGLTLPTLSETVRSRLRERLPAFVTADNPVDLGPLLASQPEILPFIGEALLADDAIGSLAVITPTGAEPIASRWLPHAVELVRSARKPVLLAIMGDDHPFPPAFATTVRDKGLLVFRSPERALRALARVTAYGRSLDLPVASGDDSAFPDLPDLGVGPQPEWRGKRVLHALGIPVPEGGLAADADAAAAIAARVGYPVALKIQAAQLTHKTEIGGVSLDIGDEAGLRAACAAMLERAAIAAPGGTLDGLLVERMSAKGVELVIGATRDPSWGPVLMVGLGGVMVEALGDVRLLAPDLNREAIVEELRSLRSAKLLGAFRGSPARDLDAVAAAVAAVGALMRSRADIVEIDVNPLVAFAEGEGVMALDALVVTRSAGSLEAEADRG